MCKMSRKMGGSKGVAFDVTDPQTVGLMVAGALGSNVIVNPIINAIFKTKPAPKYVKPLIKIVGGYLAITKQSNPMLQDVGAGAMVMGAIEGIQSFLPAQFKLQLGLGENVGAAEFDLSNYTTTSVSNRTSVSGAGVA